MRFGVNMASLSTSRLLKCNLLQFEASFSPLIAASFGSTDS